MGLLLLITLLFSGLLQAQDTSEAVTIITDYLNLLPQCILGHISDKEALVALLKISLHVNVILSSTPVRFLKFRFAKQSIH